MKLLQSSVHINKMKLLQSSVHINKMKLLQSSVHINKRNKSRTYPRNLTAFIHVLTASSESTVQIRMQCETFRLIYAWISTQDSIVGREILDVRGRAFVIHIKTSN